MEINGKQYTITEGEDGKLIFTPVREEVKQRDPKEGDVWQDKYDSYLIGENESISLGFGRYPGGRSIDPSDFSGDTYKGKFHEVYVNRAEFISEVRAALSHEDNDGDSVLNRAVAENIYVHESGAKKTFKALRKLNIITD